MTKAQKRNRTERRWARQSQARMARMARQPKFSISEMMGMTVPQLKSLARENGLRGYSKLTKDRLIDFIARNLG
jgi:hypothetical protein